jgi:hypothetical protein
MDTGIEAALIVHRIDGSEMKFAEHACGLYVHKPESNDTNNSLGMYTMLTTVSDQKKLFNPRDVARADMARQLYRMIRQPSESSFLRLLSSGSLRNCPVTALDTQRAFAIYGPDIATLKVKTTRGRASPQVPACAPVPLPSHVLEHYGNVVLCVDFFFIQGHIFLHTISRGLHFRTVRSAPNRKFATSLAAVSYVHQPRFYGC